MTATRFTARAARASSVLGSIIPSFHCGKNGKHTISAKVDLSGLGHQITSKGGGTSTRVDVSLKGTIKFKLSFSFSGAITCTAKKQVSIPLPYKLTLKIGPDFTLKARGSVGGAFTWAPSLTYGFELSRSGFSHETHSLKNGGMVGFTGNGMATLDLALKADIGTGAGRSVDVGVGGDVGPTVTAKIQSSTTGHQTCWTLKGHGLADLTAHVDVWSWLKKSWTLATKSFDQFALPQHCVGNTTPSVTVTDPGPQTSSVGTLASLQINATDSDGGTIAYTATGLPTGLSINVATGLITGTPTTPGTSNVTITGTDATGPSGNTTFNWTIIPTGGGSGATAIAAAADYSCALLLTGGVDCWGSVRGSV